MELPWDPAILLLGIYIYIYKSENTNSKKYMYLNIYSSNIYNHQDMETTLNWIDKENMVWHFTGGSVVKNLPANEGETGLIPDLGRSHMLQSKSN